jgi:EAL domain-containing protein (putative c-di-GMP-specific phosphodiesterase class I)
MLGHHSEIQRASQLLADLDGGEFELQAQRIIDLRGDDADRAPFYEVLLCRRRREDGESIGATLELAQRFGLLPQVDRWVIERAARFLQAQAHGKLRLSINIGATTLESDGFREFMLALPGRYGFAAERMVLEITEAVAVQNLTDAVETLRLLRRHGFEVALDDFGAGVASFGYLNDLPVSLVKIDGRFIRDLDTDLAAEVVIESLTRVAALRGIDCVAEWVENLSVLPRLRKLGVAYAQGYAIHRPVPLASLAVAEDSEHATGPLPAPAI